MLAKILFPEFHDVLFAVFAIACAGIFAITRGLEHKIRREVESIARGIHRSDAKLRLKASRNARRIMDKLDIDSVCDVLDSEGSDASAKTKQAFDGDALRASYKYGRMCRNALNHPKHSASNRIVACDWIRKRMTEDGLRPSQIDSFLPSAIVIAFVRSNKEIEAEILFEILEKAGRIQQSPAK